MYEIVRIYVIRFKALVLVGTGAFDNTFHIMIFIGLNDTDRGSTTNCGWTDGAMHSCMQLFYIIYPTFEF